MPPDSPLPASEHPEARAGREQATQAVAEIYDVMSRRGDGRGFRMERSGASYFINRPGLVMVSRGDVTMDIAGSHTGAFGDILFRLPSDKPYGANQEVTLQLVMQDRDRLRQDVRDGRKLSPEQEARLQYANQLVDLHTEAAKGIVEIRGIVTKGLNQETNGQQTTPIKLMETDLKAAGFEARSIPMNLQRLNEKPTAEAIAKNAKSEAEARARFAEQEAEGSFEEQFKLIGKIALRSVKAKGDIVSFRRQGMLFTIDQKAQTVTVHDAFGDERLKITQNNATYVEGPAMDWDIVDRTLRQVTAQNIDEKHKTGEITELKMIEKSTIKTPIPPSRLGRGMVSAPDARTTRTDFAKDTGAQDAAHRAAGVDQDVKTDAGPNKLKR